MKNIPLFIGIFAVLALMAMQAAAKYSKQFRNSAGKISPQYISGQGVCQPSPTIPPDDGQG
ncbi:MAG: hypothetical protein ACOYM3_15725 [Terrimicrobiaceae bacterium]